VSDMSDISVIFVSDINFQYVW